MDNQQPSSTLPNVGSNPKADKNYAAISYLGPICLISLFLKKDDKFVQFHAKQGLVLFIAELIVSFVNIIPFFGYSVWRLLSLVFFIASIVGIMKAFKGEYWKMPIIGNYAEKIKI